MKKNIFPIGCTLLIVLVLFGIFMPPPGASQEKADKVLYSSCATNLQKIFSYLKTYKENYGDFPENISDLKKISGFDKLLICPSRQDNINGYNYVYEKTMPSRADYYPIIADKLNNHPDGGNILMSDGFVRRVPTEILKYCEEEDTWSSIVPK